MALDEEKRKEAQADSAIAKLQQEMQDATRARFR